MEDHRTTLKKDYEQRIQTIQTNSAPKDEVGYMCELIYVYVYLMITRYDVRSNIP